MFASAFQMFASCGHVWEEMWYAGTVKSNSHFVLSISPILYSNTLFKF